MEFRKLNADEISEEDILDMSYSKTIHIIKKSQITYDHK